MAFEFLRKLPGILNPAMDDEADMYRTPGFNANAAAPKPVRLPMGGSAPRSLPEVQPSTGIPGGGNVTGPPPVPRQTNQQQIDEAQSVWKQGYQKPTGVFDRIKRAALPALAGAAKTGTLAGGLGGLATGMIADKQIYNERFNREIKPQILERQGREAQEAAMQRQAEDDALNRRYKEAQIRGIDAEAEARKIPKAQPRQSPIGASAPAIYDPNTGTFKQNPYYKEKPFKPGAQDYNEAYDQVVEEWGDPRDVATSSTDARKESIIDALPDQYKSILRKGKTLDGFDASPEDLTAAQNAYNRAREQDIERGTRLDTQKRKTEARRRVRGTAANGTPKTPGITIARKPVVDDRFVNFVAQKLGISPEQARQKIQSGGYEYSPPK